MPNEAFSAMMATIRPLRVSIEIADITLTAVEIRNPDHTIKHVEITLKDVVTPERIETKCFNERTAYAVIQGFLAFDEAGSAFIEHFPFWG